MTMSANMSSQSDVIFLYNHDVAHQVAHSAGILGAIALKPGTQNIIAAYASQHIRTEIEKLLSAEQIAAVNWCDLSLAGWLQTALAPINRFLPLGRLARLNWSRKKLRKAAMIVSTERTCLTLKRHWQGQNCPAFAYIPHGSGDRNVAVHPALKDFDLCLVSGQKVVDQLVEAGVSTPEKCRVIGYAKFDILRDRKPDKFFDNDNPVFLYNPHFDPHLSSWYDEGAAILEWFYQHADRYNLIFAPHVMLFHKQLHISPEYKISRRRPDIAAKYHDAPNILIDTDSARLFDMSYTLAADAYIGDVSSQVYEFLYSPRPVFFIDVHSRGPDGEPEYDFWRNGPVVKNAEELFALLQHYEAIGAEYKNIQVDRMAYTADMTDPEPACERGARAIAEYLNHKTELESQND